MEGYLLFRTFRGLGGLLLLIVLSACALFGERKSLQIPVPSESYYTFNPDTVIGDLAQGKTDILEEKGADFQPMLVEPPRPVQWTQDDYLQIAGALHQDLWKDPLANWRLGSMRFGVDCSQVGFGPQKATFVFYRPKDSVFSDSIVDETIVIDPSTNSAWRSDQIEGPPSSLPSESIDVARLLIRAEQALRLAEAQGGERARESTGNHCEVSVNMAPNGLFKDWTISYHNREIPQILVIRIDPYTGFTK